MLAFIRRRWWLVIVAYLAIKLYLINQNFPGSIVAASKHLFTRHGLSLFTWHYPGSGWEIS